MKSISLILKNIKNIVPYFLLIAVYFFFVNIEAGKLKNNNPKIDSKNTLPDEKSAIDEQNLRVKIPVIPYN